MDLQNCDIGSLMFSKAQKDLELPRSSASLRRSVCCSCLKQTQTEPLKSSRTQGQRTAVLNGCLFSFTSQTLAELCSPCRAPRDKPSRAPVDGDIWTPIRQRILCPTVLRVCRGAGAGGRARVWGAAFSPITRAWSP